MKFYALAGASFYQGKTITLIAGHCAGKEIEEIVGNSSRSTRQSSSS